MGCEPRRLSSIGPPRGATTAARAGGKFFSSRLLAAIALFTASTVSTHAQVTNWTGATSNGWFNPGNWSTGVPNALTSVNIDTVTPNSTEIRGAGATAFNVNVGQVGTGMLTIQNGGTLTDQAASVAAFPGSQGTVVVSGAGSSWTNSGLLVVGFFGTGTVTIQNGGVVNSDGGFVGLVGTGTVRVAGAGSTWSSSSGLTIGSQGTGTLTIAEGGIVAAPSVAIATGAGSIGTLNIGAGQGSPAAAPGTLNAPSVAFGGVGTGTGTINFNHTSADYVFAPAISGGGTVNVLAGTTILTGANTYFGATNVDAGTLRAGAPNTFSSSATTTVASGGTLDLHGFGQTLDRLTDAGLVNMGTGTAPGTSLFVTNYTGTGGTIAMNTFLGGDGSTSDTLVTRLTATGNTLLRITNAGGPGAETVADGIRVVRAARGTTDPGAFALAGEVRGGAFDYDLFRGGLDPSSSPNDWFLRSTFINEGPIPPGPPILPSEPGVSPIIGPEIATYGVVQPIARQLGMTTLGTLHERIGDTLLDANVGTPCPADSGTPDGVFRKAPVKAPTDCLNAGWGPSVWGRVLGQQIDNHYTAFADPRASGQLLGFQSGIDLLRGEWIPGHRDAAGIYVGYANANVDVSGLVTNEAATAYVLRHTGGLNLDAWSGGAYWTHYGPGDWYLDAVAQATHYQGAASTQFANLATTGFGFLSSLETGYPIRLPVFGPGFVLEPQAQIVWQQVSFDDANDGLGEVALGTTSGASGRIGLRGRWTIVGDSGQVWQPYVRANLWQDWGAQATTTFSGADLVPLLEQATRLQLGGGVSVRMNTNVSFYANADYQFAVGNTDGGRRDGIRGAAGVRYTWGS